MDNTSSASYRKSLWPAPIERLNPSGEIRRLGVELEFSGMSIHTIADTIVDTLGGSVERISDYEYTVAETSLGEFVVELDFSYLKRLGREKSADAGAAVDDVSELAESALALVARQVVPNEVVSPPVPFDEAWQIESLIKALREAGAKGTTDTLTNAFGMHLNPELPDLSAATILAYMRAYMCLFDWLKARCNIDIARRVTPHIEHFGKDYILHILAADYAPDMATLIDDYLHFNPTRNRSLDMLPLFSHLDPERVNNTIDDALVKSRPTFHYRLPNCQIDEPEWGLIRTWKDWLQVEFLASDVEILGDLSKTYHAFLTNSVSNLFSDWTAVCRKHLVPELL